MNAISPAVREIARWLGQLSLAVSNPPSPEDLAKRCSAIALGCSDVPPRGWCEASLAEAIRQFQFWPAAADVRKLLLAWCKANPEPRPAITDASRADWTDSDWSWLRYWQTRSDAGFPPLDGMHGVPGGDVRAHVASLVRTMSPRAWAAIAAGAA